MFVTRWKEECNIVGGMFVTRWKEECNLITRKLESKYNDCRSELSQERRRTEELTKLLQDSRNKTIEVCVCMCVSQPALISITRNIVN